MLLESVSEWQIPQGTDLVEQWFYSALLHVFSVEQPDIEELVWNQAPRPVPILRTGVKWAD